MITFFAAEAGNIYAVQTEQALQSNDLQKLSWLFAGARQVGAGGVPGGFVGPRAVMITPWSTNAVEITRNMGITQIKRIEQYWPASQPGVDFDPMLMQKYDGLDQDLFTIQIKPASVQAITDISAYNQAEGLALSTEEVAYLEQVAERIGRRLTDSEVFGFSQVNSEHCRHKIFNGVFVIDGEEQPHSLFQMIKKTSKENPNTIVSAYKDNVAFVEGPQVDHFAPQRPDYPDYYQHQSFDSVLSLKAETHNFPTTVEPFNGAATGSGGEIRDRLAGGIGALPLAGTAVYMTAYSRLQAENRDWEQAMPERPWLYQTPIDILIKASNGASDFGNKFGQPLIAGSLLTFEHEEHGRKLGFDKVIMMAGGVGFGKLDQAQKNVPQKGDKVVVLGGDNYRIGMGGAAVSSADTGAFSTGIELNAVQRSNPEMQKRVANAIRGMIESKTNRIVSIHDHGAGGHLNCLSELLEETGGVIELRALPVGDPTLSAKEIIGNESQERMGLIISPEDLPTLQTIAERERAPLYVVGEVTNDFRFVFADEEAQNPIDLELTDFFGSSPKTIMEDQAIDRVFTEVDYKEKDIQRYISSVLKLEAVACKDWLTNKVDRCVGGLVAKQQCAGPLQLPLNDYGLMSLDYKNENAIATSIGHAPVSGLIDAAAGVRNSIAEALTNIIWAPLEQGLDSISLSANWMWPCRNEGEDARLYDAVQAASDFAIALGINIPTGKDSLSMKQKYSGDEVLAPGTVIISAGGHCSAKSKAVEPVFQRTDGPIYYVDLSQTDFALGGSSFAQVRNKIGAKTPDVTDAAYFKKAFNLIQDLIKEGGIVAGHDVSAGGLLTCLLEMCFADNQLGAKIDLSPLEEADTLKVLFAENSGIVFQARDASLAARFNAAGITCYEIGSVTSEALLEVQNGAFSESFDIAKLRDDWYETSYLLDQKQSGVEKATERYQNYKTQALRYNFPASFSGQLPIYKGARPKAAVIREQGSNSEREMANALHLAGFEVKDVHMTDLISGRETLEDIQFMGAVGGFANSDVLGSAKGWAGAFLYNEKAKKALDDFFARPDTLSIGICNGCQLFLELEMITPDHKLKPKMHHNDTHKHESAFTSVKIQENNSVILSSLAGTTLGVWISHGEGKFHLPMEESAYHIVGKYGYEGYPANPNGSDYNTAMLCSADGRHLVSMPHLERSIFQWNWAYYPKGRKDEVSPWLEAFVNAREWILAQDR
ncbi:MAG TPA: phosphoribosylformylglycinamidine synthase [Saprospiraceae bacterium]|nr:phosphoribosylformylglycinamidine synthase [Saprospiraceae bacterium]